MATKVRTQEELDAAIRAGAAAVYIESDAGVWLALLDSGSSHVVARESSHVVAWGSSHVEARESSHVEAWGSSHVEARESSHVVARESSHVVARESSHVEAAPYVAVHLHSQRVTLSGGVVIDCTAIDLHDPQPWCDYHGVKVTDGIATLYKALDADLKAGHTYTVTKYTPGRKVSCKDWRDDNECGGGLHLGPTTSNATAYMADAARWVAVEVPIADLRPILGSTAKCKVKACKVVAEVNRWGAPL